MVSISNSLLGPVQWRLCGPCYPKTDKSKLYQSYSTLHYIGLHCKLLRRVSNKRRPLINAIYASNARNSCNVQLSYYPGYMHCIAIQGTALDYARKAATPARYVNGTVDVIAGVY